VQRRSGNLSPLEGFHNTLYFVEGVNVLAWDASSQRQSVGDPHVAWELQNDVRDHGEAVLRCAGPFLAESERANIALLLSKLGNLSTDSLRSSEGALDRPEWEGLRHEARYLLDALAGPIAANLAFFNHGKPTARP
jgi:hypothetical protein